MFMEGFAAGCAFPRESTRPERESAGEAYCNSWRIKKPIAIDGAGADGSAEGRRRFFHTIFCRFFVPCTCNEVE